MVNIFIKAVTKILSTKLAIRLLYNTNLPSNSKKFQVGFATLQLKNALIKYVKPGDKVLDMGTGALGVLSIWLKKNKKNVKVTAVDVYDELIENVKKVFAYNKVKVKVIKSDLMKNVKGKFDLIAFNPPLHPKITYKLVDRFLKQAPKCKIILSSNKYYINLKKLENVIKKNNYKFIEIVKSPLNPANAYVIIKNQ